MNGFLIPKNLFSQTLPAIKSGVRRFLNVNKPLGAPLELPFSAAKKNGVMGNRVAGAAGVDLADTHEGCFPTVDATELSPESGGPTSSPDVCLSCPCTGKKSAGTPLSGDKPGCCLSHYLKVSLQNLSIQWHTGATFICLTIRFFPLFALCSSNKTYSRT